MHLTHGRRTIGVLAATVASDWPRALHWGRVGLSVFGLEWPLEGLGAAPAGGLRPDG